MIETETETCIKCYKVKPSSSFYGNAGSEKNTRWCKDCIKEWRKELTE